MRTSRDAAREAIFRLVVGEGLVLGGVGVALGIRGSLAAPRVLTRLLVGVTATDPPTYVAIAVLFLIIATIATWSWPTVESRPPSRRRRGCPRRSTAPP